MLGLFEELQEQPEKQDLRFILTLLMLRRRVMRLEESETDEQGQELMVVYCPKRDKTYKVPATPPTEARTEEIQEYLGKLLY